MVIAAAKPRPPPAAAVGVAVRLGAAAGWAAGFGLALVVLACSDEGRGASCPGGGCGCPAAGLDCPAGGGEPAAGPLPDGGSAPRTLRVMSFNIRHGADGSLEEIAAVIHAAEPDLVGLQEVDVGWRSCRGTPS